MNMNTLGNILQDLSPDNSGFAIYGKVETEADFNEKVVFTDPGHKPTWGEVQSGRGPEQWVVVRGLRDSKLNSCDWTQLPDVPMDPSKKTEWETYRQELRDITNQPDPFNITWPAPPA